MAVAIPLAAAAWFVEVAWCAFGGGETSPVLAVVTFFCLIFFGLFVGGAALGRDMTPVRARTTAPSRRSSTARSKSRPAASQAAKPSGRWPPCRSHSPSAFTVIALIAVSA